MDTIRKTIREYKPQIKDNSLNLYLRNLKIVYQQIGSFDGEPSSIAFLQSFDSISKLLMDKPLTTRKNILTSIIVALKAYKKTDLLVKYQVLYLDSIDDYNTFLKSQKKSVKENINWIPLKELKNVLDDYKQKLEKNYIFILDDKKISKDNFFLLQKYITGMLYIGSIDNPPIRLEYAPMKIIKKKVYDTLPVDKQNDENFLVITGKNKKEFILNKYKTFKTYGQQRIKLSPVINKVINIWLHYNTSEYLLLNKNMAPLQTNGLTRLINAVFEPTGKLISASMIRHIFISEVFPADKKKREDIAKLMQHSITTQTDYAKE